MNDEKYLSTSGRSPDPVFDMKGEANVFFMTDEGLHKLVLVPVHAPIGMEVVYPYTLSLEKVDDEK